MAAIIVGYLTDSLPAYYLNDVDVDITKRFQQSSFVSLLSKLHEHWERLWAVLLKTPRKRETVAEQASSNRRALTAEERNDALVPFVLVLSDQQLVTGLAILIGAYANASVISNYEFSVVVSLVWFPSTTHLATLDVLHKYFRTNKVVRNWRIFGMLIMLILLIIGNVISLFKDD